MANRAEKRRKQKSGKNAGNGGGNSLFKGLGAWWKDFQQSKSPILIFLLKFLAVMIPFYVIFYTPFFQDNILHGWNVLNTHVASFVLNIFGAGTEAVSNTLIDALAKGRPVVSSSPPLLTSASKKLSLMVSTRECVPAMP